MREASEAHETFAADPDVLQLLLQDHASAMQCRRTFGHEAYFQQVDRTLGRGAVGPNEDRFLLVEDRSRLMLERDLDRKLL